MGGAHWRTPSAVSTSRVDKRFRFFRHYYYATFLWCQEEENCWQDHRQSPRKLGKNYESWIGGCASVAERWILCCCSSWCCWGKKVSAFTYANCCAFERMNAHQSHLVNTCCLSAISALKDKHPPSIPFSLLQRWLPFFYSPLRMLTTMLYFKHVLRESHRL